MKIWKFAFIRSFYDHFKRFHALSIIPIYTCRGSFSCAPLGHLGCSHFVSLAKIGKNEINFHDHFRISWIIRNNEPARPCPTVTLFDCLFLGRKMFKMGTKKFDAILIQVLDLCYQNLGPISLIVWELCALRHHSNFSNFQQFVFMKTFDWKGNFIFW